MDKRHCRCSFKNCASASTSTEVRRFFRYPVKNKERTLEWLTLSGNNALLDLSDSQLGNRHVCSDHFSPEEIFPSGRLFPCARPRAYTIEYGDAVENEVGLAAADVLEDHAVENGVVLAAADVLEDHAVENGVGLSAADVLEDHAVENGVGLAAADVLEDHVVENGVGLAAGGERSPELLPMPADSDSDSDWSASQENIDSEDDADIHEDGDIADEGEADADLITPRKLKLKTQITKLQTINARKRAKIAKLQRQDFAMSNDEAVKKLVAGASTEAAGTFIRMQGRSAGSKAPWTKAERELALSMHYKSPALYAYMRDVVGMRLPGYSTIVRWVQQVDLRTGIPEKLFEQLKTKVATMSDEERHCVLMFDEMAIKKWLEYDHRLDLVEGFEDLGPCGRSPAVATEAMVFMIRGLNVSWKQHVAYFLAHNGVTAETLILLVDMVITRLFDIGLKVRACVCDQGPANRAAYRLLGVTPEKPYFRVGDEKIIAMFDAPHLLKSTRNNLSNKPKDCSNYNDFAIGDRTVSWRDIVRFYYIDSEKGTTGVRAAPKLTMRHLFPGSFAKMSVKLAAQVFSHSTTAGMATAISTGQLTSSTAIYTKEFVWFMNNLFDALNSRFVYDATPHRRPLRGASNGKLSQEEKAWLSMWIEEEDASEPTIEEAESPSEYPDTANAPLRFLVLAREFFKLWSLRKDRVNPPCFDGLRLTVNAILMLWDDMRDEGFLLLLTSRCNQDYIENSFAVIRNRGGCNTNPTARVFRLNLQHSIMVHLLNPPKTSNCEADEDVWLTAIDSEDAAPDVLAEAPRCHEKRVAPVAVVAQESPVASTSREADLAAAMAIETDQAVDSDVDDPLDFQQPTLDICSLTYVAGWLARRGLRKHDCVECRQVLVNEGQHLSGGHEGLIYYRAFMTKDGTDLGNLLAPSDQFLAVVKSQNDFFCATYPEIRHLKSVRNTVSQKLKRRQAGWFSGPCAEHRSWIMELFVRTKLYYDAKWLARDIRDCPSKPSVLAITKDVSSRGRSARGGASRGVKRKAGQRASEKLKKLQHL